MTEDNALGAELVRRGGGGGNETGAVAAAAAAERDARRIRSLAAATIGFWLLAALLIPAVLMPLWAKLKGHAGDPRVTPEVALESLAIVATYIAVVSTVASLLAASCTVWLVLTVRRSTLRQISSGLAQISEQLAAMRSGEKGTGRG
jgi:hypothetical protein